MQLDQHLNLLKLQREFNLPLTIVELVVPIMFDGQNHAYPVWQ